MITHDEEIRQWCIERAMELYERNLSANTSHILVTASNFYKFVMEGKTSDQS